MSTKHIQSLTIALLLATFLSSVFVATTSAAPTASPTAALTWLEAAQRPTGGWGDVAATRDTALAVRALAELKPGSGSLRPAYAWLRSRPARNTADRARIVTALGSDGAAALGMSQNVATASDRPNAPEGGWGAAAGYASDSLDTALALAALARANIVGEPVARGIAYLSAAQNADGGWGVARGADNSLAITAQVVISLSALPKAAGAQAIIDKGKAYLLAQQNADGGWGAGNSTVSTSGLALYALRLVGAKPTKDAEARAYLLTAQSADGSWNKRPYDTALALLALGGQREIFLPIVRK